MQVTTANIVNGLQAFDTDLEGFLKFMESANFTEIFLTPTLPLEAKKAFIVVTGVNPPMLGVVECESLEEAENWFKEQEQWKGKRRFPIDTTGFKDAI